MRVFERMFVLLLSVGVAVPVHQAFAREATTAHPIVLELFTSEGCSSCPPADAWVHKMDGAQPIQGAELIVMSEHVDYWNHDGWKDPYSSAWLTGRQNSYLHTLHTSEIYTPQLVVNGTAELKLSDPAGAKKVFDDALRAPTTRIAIKSLTVDQDSSPVLRARIETDAAPGDHNAAVYVAVALDHAESEVLHGENGGKHLSHVSVVQSITKVGKMEQGKSFAQDFQLKLKAHTDPANIRVIAFIQESGQGRVLGAVLQKGPFAVQ